MKRSLAVLLVMLLPLGARAEIALDAAKHQGLVGEDASGYLAAVTSQPSDDVRALIDKVNSARRAEYERIASQNGIAVGDVEKLAGKKAIDKTAPGDWIRLPGEAWRKK